MDGALADRILSNKMVALAYFAVLLVLVLLVVWMVRGQSQKTERLIGTGVSDIVFTSGATQRRLGTEFSSTNQGEYTIVHNDELKELVPGVIPGKSERLVNNAEPPVFWEISPQLDAYRMSQTAGLAADAAADAASAAASGGTEHLASSSVASIVQDELLRQQLYH
jgi:hypothetical protein